MLEGGSFGVEMSPHYLFDTNAILDCGFVLRLYFNDGKIKD